MLGGLGKELRRCGIDTLILENEKEHSECARVSQRTLLRLACFKRSNLNQKNKFPLFFWF